MSEKVNTSIVIAEDNLRDLDFLLNTLKNEDQFTSAVELLTAENGKQAYQLIAESKATRIISDIQMPEMTGIDLARRIWNETPLTRIIFWSHYNDEIYLRSLQKIIPPETVYGYVLKNKPAETLLSAIHSVFEECQCWIDPDIRSVQARSQKKPTLITDAEFEVLIDIALGLTDNLIAKRRFLSRRGVQNRLKSLYQKLEVDHLIMDEDTLLNSRSRAISIALQRGLINTHELSREEKELSLWLAHVS